MNRLFRIPPQDRAIGSPLSDWTTRPLLPQQADFFNEPAVNFPETDARNPNEINGRFSADFEPRPAPPLDLLGGGQRQFPGARTAARRRRLAAVIAAELGTAGKPTVSTGGVRCFVIPKRVR